MDAQQTGNNINSTNCKICSLLGRHDIKGLELLFEAYYNPLVLLSNSLLNDLSKAEDLVQEFFIATWEQKIYQKFHPHNLSSFLRVIIKNRTLSYMRKKDVLNDIYDIDEIEVAWEEYNEHHEQLIRIVDAEITKLPPRSQEIVRLIFWEGLKYQQVADRLNISLSTVKTLSVKSLKKLKESLDESTLFYFLMCFFAEEKSKYKTNELFVRYVK